jgi:hypothetical protein
MSSDLRSERTETGIGSYESYPRSLHLNPRHRFGLSRVFSSLRVSCPGKIALTGAGELLRNQGPSSGSW